MTPCTRAGLMLLALVWAGGCNRQLPPAPTPATSAPDVEPTVPPAQGEGTLIIDIVDGPAPVQRIFMKAMPLADAQSRVRYEFVESPEILCKATPCAVNLPVGNVLLGFPVTGTSGSVDVELLHVDPEKTVYRRKLSFYQPERGGGVRTLGIIGAALGGTAMTAGVAMLPVGLAKDIDGLTLAASISLGAGSALTALGIWAILGTSSSYRPGSAIHFSF